MKKIILYSSFALLFSGILSFSNKSHEFNLMENNSLNSFNDDYFEKSENDSRLVLTSQNKNSIAYSGWEASYSNEGITLFIEFMDEDLYYGNIYDIGYDDNVEFIINQVTTESNWSISKTFHFLINPEGKVYFQKANTTNSFGASFDPYLRAVNGENIIYTCRVNDREIDGYNGFKVSIFLSYDVLNTTYEDGFGNLALCPGMRNTHIYGKDTIWTSYSKRGCKRSDSSSFVKINSDNTFSA